MSCSSTEIWFWKSSCWLRSLAMQQPVLSNWQTGGHFVCNPQILNPHSSSIDWSPHGSPLDVVIFCGHPHFKWSGFDCGIIVLCCFHCLPPSPLFISNSQSASGGSDACTDELSKIKKATHSGPFTFSWIWIAALICSSRLLWVHQASPFAPGYIILHASSPSDDTSLPRSSDVMKSDTWIMDDVPSILFVQNLLIFMEPVMFTWV